MIQNLSDYGKNRRTLHKLGKDNLLDFKNPRQIYEIIHRNEWSYRTTPEFYHVRDRALAAMLFITSGRINEVLRVRRNQIIEYPDDPDFMIIQGFYVSKRKAGKDHPMLDIPLPLVGKLSAFTYLILDYVKLLGPRDKLFQFGRARGWAIIRHITKDPNSSDLGWFCHWFRAQSLSYQVNLIRSTVAVAKQRGVENPATLMNYYRGDWRLFRDELKQ